jgi:hypothetical protein
MDVRKIIERAVEPGVHYDPEQMNIIGDAFDRAWNRLQQDIKGNDESIENARTKLAKAVLSLAQHGAPPLQADALADKALEGMFSDPIEL